MLTMVMPPLTRPPGTGASLGPDWLLKLVRGWVPERLLVLGSGPVPVLGARGGALALDDFGDTVLVVSLEAVSPTTGAQLADELDRLAQMGAVDLRHAEPQPPARDTIEDRHAAFFGVSAPPLNRRQHTILLVEEEPSPSAWRRLSAELGDRLRGVYLVDASRVTPLPVPETARATKGDKAPPSLRTWLSLGAVILGVGLLLLGAARILNPPSSAEAGAAVVPSIKTVATGVPGDATHTQWIGQQRIVHTSDGRLLALYAAPEGLHIVSDNADNGATWRSPEVITSIRPTSFSVAMDASNRLHLAYSDLGGVSYGVLTRAGSGWRASGNVRLDRHTKTPVVDLAWDDTRQVAHVVWAKETSSGQEPHWAAVASKDGKSRVVESRALAAPGDKVTVLVNAAVDPLSGELLATYRGGGSALGWTSRTATSSATTSWTWSAPQSLPIESTIGAAALAFDAHGTAHLVLRDSTNYRLLYLTHRAKAGWSKSETVVQALATSQVDFPALSLDAGSKVVYLFFETDQFETAPEIRVAIRTPAAAWQQPILVSALPEGNFFPTALRNSSGQAIALWTRGSNVASIEASRVISP